MSQQNPLPNEIDAYAMAWLTNGGDQSKAWRVAFPNSKAKPKHVHTKASEMHAKVEVQRRIAELQERQAKKAEEEFDLTASQIKQLLYSVYAKSAAINFDRDGNEKPANAGAAVSALAEINRMNGNHAAEKRELSNPDGSLAPRVIERRIIDPKHDDDL